MRIVNDLHESTSVYALKERYECPTKIILAFGAYYFFLLIKKLFERVRVFRRSRKGDSIRGAFLGFRGLCAESC